MVMIQDGPQNTGADKPLRISGEPFKVQVGPQQLVLLTYLIYLHGDPWSSAVIRCAFFSPQQAKEMVMELIRDQGFREQRGEYGSRVGGGGGGGGGGDSLDVSIRNKSFHLIRTHLHVSDD